MVKLRLWIHKKERIKQWGRIEEASFREDIDTRHEVLMEDSQAREEQQLRDGADHGARLEEPKVERKRDRTKTETGRAYLERKKQRKKENKRKKRLKTIGERNEDTQAKEEEARGRSCCTADCDSPGNPHRHRGR